MENKNPLSPHIQIYSWHISSLVSIGHRITGVINIIILTLIFFWLGSLLLGEKNYEIIFNFFNSFLGKFLAINLQIRDLTAPTKVFAKFQPQNMFRITKMLGDR